MKEILAQRQNLESNLNRVLVRLILWLPHCSLSNKHTVEKYSAEKGFKTVNPVFKWCAKVLGFLVSKQSMRHCSADGNTCHSFSFDSISCYRTMRRIFNENRSMSGTFSISSVKANSTVLSHQKKRQTLMDLPESLPLQQ